MINIRNEENVKCDIHSLSKKKLKEDKKYDIHTINETEMHLYDVTDKFWQVLPSTVFFSDLRGCTISIL